MQILVVLSGVTTHPPPIQSVAVSTPTVWRWRRFRMHQELVDRDATIERLGAERSRQGSAIAELRRMVMDMRRTIEFKAAMH